MISGIVLFITVIFLSGCSDKEETAHCGLFEKDHVWNLFHIKKYTIEHRKRNEGSIKFYEKKTFRKEEQIGMCESLLYSEFSPVLPEDCGCSAPPSWSNWCNKQRSPVCFRLVCAGFSLRCSRFPPSVPVCLSSNRRREQRPLRRRNPAALYRSSLR